MSSNFLTKIKTINSILVLIALYLVSALLIHLALSTTYQPITQFGSLRILVLSLFLPILIKYIIHLIIAPWYPFREYIESKRYPANRHQTVSVLIPAFNEEVGICATIQSVIKTAYENLEIIIIDDGSTDNTHSIVTQFIAEYYQNNPTSNLVMIHKKIPNGGKAAALNIALELASGEIIITVDADSIMDSRAIHNMVRRFSDPRVASVAGNVAIGNRSTPIGILQQLEYLYGFYFKRADSIMDAVYIVGGAAASYRSSILREVGGFDDSIITEDIELSTRIQDHGYKVRYAADAIVYTEGPSDYAGLTKQRLRWKYGRLLTFNKYKHMFFSLAKRHNKYLTFVILPIALFAELLLLFEWLLLAIFYTYTIYTRDYVPLMIVAGALTLVVILQILSDPKRAFHSNLLLLSPVAWMVFYAMDFVEFVALIKSIKQIITGKKLRWQRWHRTGVFQDNKENNQ